MSYHDRNGSSSYGSSRSENAFRENDALRSWRYVSLLDSYGGSSFRTGSSNSYGNSLLDDLDTMVVAPLRPGPPVIKRFYNESPAVAARPQVRTSIV